MNYNKKTVKDMDVKGKKVLLRCDFNVPMAKDGSGVITDDKRIRAALPTIQYLLDQGAAIIACSHMGKPEPSFEKFVKKGTEKGKDPAKLTEEAWKKSLADLTLAPVANRLGELLNMDIIMAKDVVGEDAQAKAAALQPGQILLLENTRFEKGEKKNDPEFTKALAAMAFLIERAISKFLYMSSTTAIEAAPVRTPEANTAARKRREYTKSDTFDSFEEYAEGLNESYLKLFEELRDFLEDDFPAMLEFEFKDDFTNTINIRPVNKKKRKGIPAPLLAITTLKKKKGATMRVRCGDRFSLDLTDSVEQVLGHAQDIRERFLELSSDSLRNDSPK